MIEVTGLHIYPVKSLRGIDLNESPLTVRGLRYDRNWMITDDDWNCLTQREISKMATISTTISSQLLTLHHEDHDDLEIDLLPNSSPAVKTKMWMDDCEVVDEGLKASRWLTGVLGSFKGKSLKLVRMSDHFKRPVGLNSNLDHGDAHTALADAYPFLITSESSLQKLNELLTLARDEAVPMNRFRPNIVVKGIPEFSEYNTNDLEDIHNQYTLGSRKPSQRCKMTTINQLTADIPNPKQPLKTLASINPFTEAGAYFGQYAVLMSGENQTIKIGDKLNYQ